MHESHRRVACHRTDLDVWQYFSTSTRQSQAIFGSRIMHIRARKGKARRLRRAQRWAAQQRISALFCIFAFRAPQMVNFIYLAGLHRRKIFGFVRKISSLFAKLIFGFLQKVNLIYPSNVFCCFFCLLDALTVSDFLCAACTILKRFFLHAWQHALFFVLTKHLHLQEIFAPYSSLSLRCDKAEAHTVTQDRCMSSASSSPQLAARSDEKGTPDSPFVPTCQRVSHTTEKCR